MTSPYHPPTRAVRDYLSDSLVWRDFLADGGFAEGDIVVADPFKAGTTWVQRIIQQILADGAEPEGSLSDSSPWLDSSWGDHADMLRTLSEQRAAGVRRVIKSHLPADALPRAPQANTIFVGRNGKDLVISLHKYLANFSTATLETIDTIHAAWSGDPTPLVIPGNVQDFFDRWLDTDGYQCCDLFDITASWWQRRAEPNVLLVHYAQLRDDLPGQVERVARFLSVDPVSLDLDTIVAHCSFDYMKQHADRFVPFGGAHMSSAKAFFDKGPARDYRSELTPEQIERFDRTAQRVLGEECATWLETGGVPTGA